MVKMYLHVFVLILLLSSTRSDSGGALVISNDFELKKEEFQSNFTRYTKKLRAATMSRPIYKLIKLANESNTKSIFY